MNGYYISTKNNPQLLREQLESLGLVEHQTIPINGVKFNWIARTNEIDWKTYNSNFQIINHILNEKHLSNKGLLFTNLRMKRRNFLPETYLLDRPKDRIDFERNFRAGSVWICKPVDLSCGREVFLFRTREQLHQQLTNYHRNSRSSLYSNRLVQKYLEQPLLIHGQKFDIRTYFLCICLSNELLCFACQTGYLRLSIYPYNLDDNNPFVHLTNQSIQTKDRKFAQRRDQTGMTMEEFNEYFNQFIQPTMHEVEKDWVSDQLPKKIAEILRQVADAVRKKLIILEGCFGFYGVDILIDQKLNCWLLEINSGPTLGMTNSALEKVIPICLKEAIYLVLTCLENSRSLGCVFPLPPSDVFTYLPSTNSCKLPPIISSYLPNCSNNRINLTPRGKSPSKTFFRKPFSHQLTSL